MRHDEHNTRRILLDLGIGDFNATMVLPYMFMGPAQTDPAMAQVKLITKAMQRYMIGMGATWLTPTGIINDDTAHCLHALVGPHWNQTTWQELAKSLIIAKGNGKRLHKRYNATNPVDLSGLSGHASTGFIPDLPSVPGGIVTYAVVGYLLYRHFKKGQ
jgi:hypothetical protein